MVDVEHYVVLRDKMVLIFNLCMKDGCWEWLLVTDTAWHAAAGLYLL